VKVLAVNKFYYIKGGSETYYFSLKEILESKGHKVMDFSMKDPKNYSSDYEKFFVENVDYNKAQSALNKVKMASKIIYSFEAKNRIKNLINFEKPDVAHLHIFQHQLSPSILPILKRSNIPIVYTAHDLKAVCGNYKMLNNGHVCEKCKGGKHINCLINKCVKESRLKSLINAVEMYFHDFRGYYNLIDMVVTPSEFYRKKLVEAGFYESKVVHIPNFLDADKFEACYEHKNYFVYLGRLSEEKGIFTLFKAMRYIDDAELYVIGTGPVEAELKQFIEKEGLHKRIKMVGFKSGKELEDIIRMSMFSIMPSEWYENGPYSLLEMMAYGKPVIGSDIGGIPEFIDNGRTGLIFKKGSVEELSKKIRVLLDNKEIIINFGKNARIKLENEYNSLKHYNRINNIYESVLHKKS
jgi:glycosyltransferase involved in cell wall biosynthesis